MWLQEKEILKMENCMHKFNSEDESFLLDDNNTDSKRCIRCKKIISTDDVLFGESSWIESRVRNNSVNRHHSDDCIDSPDDSPLLLNVSHRENKFNHKKINVYCLQNHLNELGNLTIEEFHCHSYHKGIDNNVASKKLVAVSILSLLFMVIANKHYSVSFYYTCTTICLVIKKFKYVSNFR